MNNELLSEEVDIAPVESEGDPVAAKAPVLRSRLQAIVHRGILRLTLDADWRHQTYVPGRVLSPFTQQSTLTVANNISAIDAASFQTFAQKNSEILGNALVKAVGEAHGIVPVMRSAMIAAYAIRPAQHLGTLRRACCRSKFRTKGKDPRAI